MKSPHKLILATAAALLATMVAATLTSCAAVDGLALSYTRRVSGLDVTGFYSADGTGGILIKRSGKEPVKAQK